MQKMGNVNTPVNFEPVQIGFRIPECAASALTDLGKGTSKTDWHSFRT